ncbi:MAG: DegT/DnrJ/EryC1/StrS family aminotransferase [Candidatus Krumholzibacteria bacterium]|nr:DegT/DnrJ/EryC1/StrS family aminotransferase [Candidatus Krumholzibacteria bacterium]
MKIPLLDLAAQYRTIKGEIREAVEEVFESQRFILGPRVAELEERIAAYCGVSRAVGTASGSDAILLALSALGIGPGDEVITTPYSFFSTVSSVTRLGARPVFADIDPRTFNIDPARVAGSIGPRTKAILVVHLYGQTAEMDPILDAAASRGIPVIEDACQAIGARCRGRAAGSMGLAGCFSFFPSKNLGGAGDGGMVVTGDDSLADRIRVLREHGARRRYYHDEVGINSRLDAIQAAVLLVKLRRLDEWSEGRRRNAARYDELLGAAEGVVTPAALPHNRHIYNQYVIRAARRDDLKEHLQGAGIGCEVYYPVPLHLQACLSFLGGKEGDCPEAERAASETLALPVYPELTAAMQDEVAGAIGRFYAGRPGTDRAGKD